MTDREKKQREVLKRLWYMGNRHDREIDVDQAISELSKLDAMPKEVEEAVGLLKEARKILADYWFSEDGEYNNDDVIEIDKKIQKFLKANPNISRGQ